MSEKEYPIPPSVENMVTVLVLRGYTREEINAEYQKRCRKYATSRKEWQENLPEGVGISAMSNLMREMPKKPNIVPAKFIYLGKGQTFAAKGEERMYTSFLISDIDIAKKTVKTKTISADADATVDYVTFLANGLHPFVMYDAKLALKEDENYFFTAGCDVGNPQPLIPLDQDPYASVTKQLQQLGIPKMTVAQAMTYRSKTKGKRTDETDVVAVFGQFASKSTLIETKMLDPKKVPISMGLANIVDQSVDRSEKRNMAGRIIYPGLTAKVDPATLRIVPREGDFCFIGSIGEYEHKASMNCYGIITIFSPEDQAIEER
jgi:hypothetical protein